MEATANIKSALLLKNYGCKRDQACLPCLSATKLLFLIAFKPLGSNIVNFNVFIKAIFFKLFSFLIHSSGHFACNEFASTLLYRVQCLPLRSPFFQFLPLCM